MKRIFLISFVLVAFSVFAQKQEMRLSISNPNSVAVDDAPVCVKLQKGNKWKGAVVKIAGKEIPSQMDDLDGDGVCDELAFVVSMKRGEKVTANVTFSTKSNDGKYPSRVHAQMWFKDKTKGLKYYEYNHIPTDTVSEVEDNMYSTMYHHGPAFESDQVAYRVYFDAKESTDLYGKRVRQLELAKGMWYSSEEPDTVAKYSLGDDIILVGQTISIGTLRGWDDTKDNPTFAMQAPATKVPDPCMVMIKPFKWRQAQIVKKGPVRTVVDMNVRGWEYKDRVIDLKSRYILYAGNRECIVEQYLECDDCQMSECALDDVEFVTGVMKVGCFNTDSIELAEMAYMDDGRGLCASYGKDWPDGNHKLYPQMSTTGLAVSIPNEYVTRTIDRKEQILYGIRPIKNFITYRMAFCAPDKETFVEKWNSRAWFDWCRKWNEIKPLIIITNK